MDLQDFYPVFFYLAAAAAAVFFAEAAYLIISSMVARRRVIDRRLKALDGELSGEQVLLQLRRERGIGTGDDNWLTETLSRLLIQAGLRLTLLQFVLLMAAVSAAIAALCYYLSSIGLKPALIVGVLGGFCGSISVVLLIRSRRQSRFVSQLPDAIDVIVRSLRSGHPVPAAMTMVARELDDPIGTEFGIMVDEMTYGLDSERSLRNMYDRVGSPDLLLLVTAISLQMATGGNLAEILGNLTKIMRDRFQLRRKVRALSAEGRVSAYALSAFPFIMFLAINAQNPTYYGNAWKEPIFIPALVLLGIWALIGNIIMFKMINFKY
jgi:tight adherence protein B